MKSITIQKRVTGYSGPLKSISALVLLSHLSSGCMIVQATISTGAAASTAPQSTTSSTSSNTSSNTSGSTNTAGSAGGSIQTSPSASPTATLSADARLSALTLSSGTLSPAFAACTLSYTDLVASTVTSIALTPTVNQANASVKVNNVTVNSGTASTSIALSVGTNTVTVLTTAQDGSTHTTYTITVTRAAPSSVASLSALTLSSGTLSPPFSTGTTTYTTTNSASNITVTPTVTQANATVKVNGTATTSGSASAALPMSNGSNTVTVLVTAQDGTTQSTYTITVYQPTLTGGAQWDSTNSYYRLGTSGFISNLELSADWTPAWSNIVGYWKLNETSGASSVADSGPVGTNTGTPASGVTLGATGKLNTSATFNNSNTAYISINPVTSFYLMSSGTISGWVNGGGNFIGGLSNMSNNRQFAINAGTHFGVTAVDTNSNILFVTSTVNSFPTNVWHHIAYTSVSGSGTFKLYVDGILQSMSVSTGSITDALFSKSFQSSDTIQIGNKSDNGAIHEPGFSGTIDDVAIWNTALSASAINTIYQHQSAKYSGTITSAIQDALSSVTWSSLSWLPTLPFFKALPDAGVSETAANYTGLTNSTLMNGIVGLWHLDEAAGTSGASSVLDKSGNTNNGTPSGGVTFGAPGKLNTGASFNGASYITLPTISLGTPTGFTLGLWMNSTSTATNDYFFTQGPTSQQFSLGLSGAGYINYYPAAGNTRINSTSKVNDGSWHYITWVYNTTGPTIAIYVDGTQQVSSAAAAATWNSWGLGIGSDLNNCSFNGCMHNTTLDEVAIWNRPLSAAEVTQLYRRGANRMMFQVRSCSDASCTTGSPSWLGPDGTSQTYFSELYNTSDNALTSAVQAVLPTMTFSNAVFSVLGLSTNQYFQYRSIMETDDGNTLCDYGAGATACSPELISVTPTHL